MAVNDFKNTQRRDAFRILDKDRAIIERGIALSNFGRGKEDFIEFTLYDASDNQLPQGDSGELTRYISINQLNINEYFLVKDNGEDGGVEYFIDVEKLIREAGYNQGIFKVQYQLLNNRVGRYNTEKLYIHEIAPSRTEVRLLPVTNKDGIVDEDLFKRYQTFTSKGTFRDDVQYAIEPFLDSINFRGVIEKFLGKFGKKYIDQIKKEFKINNFEDFVIQVEKQVKESARYFVDGKYWNPKDKINYGKPRPDAESSQELLDINELLKNILTVTCDIIDMLLPKRNIQDETYTSMAFDESVDVKAIIDEVTSDTTYEPSEPEPEEEVEPNDPPDFPEEEVEEEEDEIITQEEPDNTPKPFLTVTPAQTGVIPSSGGGQVFTVNSSSPVSVTISPTPSGDWVKGPSSLRLGKQKANFIFSTSVRDKIYDGTLSPGFPTTPSGGNNYTTPRGGGGGGQRMEDGTEEFRNPNGMEILR